MSDFADLPDWAERFKFWHHSPSGCNRPHDLEFFEKAVARPAKIWSPANSPMLAGTLAETHAKRVVIDGDDQRIGRITSMIEEKGGQISSSQESKSDLFI